MSLVPYQPAPLNQINFPDQMFKLLGDIKYIRTNKYQDEVCWGGLGKSSLTIIHDKEDNLWWIQFHLVTDGTTYRKIMDWSNASVAESWLALNQDFILLNMP